MVLAEITDYYTVQIIIWMYYTVQIIIWTV